MEAQPEKQETDELLRRALKAKAHASLRAEGSVRTLGDLQFRGVEGERCLHLSGAKRRDQILPPGSPVILTVLLDDQVLSVRTRMLEPILASEGDTLFPPVLRIEWPSQRIQVHQRRDVRVATPELPPLRATLLVEGKRLVAELLNLTETGMGLGLAEAPELGLHTQVEVETTLPGGFDFRTTGDVRHVEEVEGGPLPVRLGLVLGCMTQQAREALRRFIQARRTDLSEALRQAH